MAHHARLYVELPSAPESERQKGEGDSGRCAYVYREHDEARPDREARYLASLEETVRRVAKNFSWLLLAQIVARIIRVAYGAFLARFLGVSDFGTYVYVITYVTSFTALSEFGVGFFLVRDLSRHQERAGQYFSNVLVFRLAASLMVYVVLLSTFMLLRPSHDQVVLVAIFALTLFTGAFSGTAEAIFNAREEMHVAAVGQALVTLLTAVFGVLVLRAGFGLEGLFVATAAGSALVVLPYVIFLLRAKLLRWVSMQRRLWNMIVRESFPYAVLGFLGIIYFKIDTLMLSWYRGQEAVGIYGAAYRILEASLFVPNLFVTALFPAMSRLHLASREKLRRLYLLSMAVLFGLGLVLAGVTFTFAGTIIQILYGSTFRESAPVLRILSLGMAFFFAHTSNSIFLWTGGRRFSRIIWLSVVSAVSNILMNLYAIPHFGYIGASVTTVISILLSLLLFTPLVFLSLRREAP